MHYKAIKLVKRPDITITPDLFEVVTLETPELKDGQFLIKQTHMSLDPAMKGWMTEDRQSYIPPVELGDIMRSSGVGEVVESKHSSFAVGDRVTGMMGWTEYAVAMGPVCENCPKEYPRTPSSALRSRMAVSACAMSSAVSKLTVGRIEAIRSGRKAR